MAYLRLIWMYYDTEKPLPNDAAKLAFQVGASVEDVALILDHFFKLEDDLYIHGGCEKVLNDYRSKAEKAANSANARWKNANALRPQSKRNAKAPKKDANQEPITNNQEEEKKDKSANAPPNGVSDSVWADFKKLRTGKKAPITDTALAGMVREAEKAGVSLEEAMTTCCERGWAGFKADWITDKKAMKTTGKHAGFDQLDYNQGINDDGTFD